jgi:hypothetical protein
VSSSFCCFNKHNLNQNTHYMCQNTLVAFVSTHNHLTFMEYKEVAESCWVMAYGRGIGKPISDCPDGLERIGLLCYRKRAKTILVLAQYAGKTALVALERTVLSFCFKPAPYGRGAGYALWDLDKYKTHKAVKEK